MIKPKKLAKIEEKDSSDYELKLSKHRQKKIILGAIVILLLIMAVAYGINYIVNIEYNTYEVLTKTARADGSTVKYEKYGKNLLKYSRDGASAIDGKGQELWNGTYNMKDPAADISGEYVVIADIGNETLVLFDGKGNSVSADIQQPILKVRVAKQGVVFVLLQDTGGNRISVYDPFTSPKKILYDIATNTEDHGYPIDIDISEDGKKLVTSYINVNSGTIENTINFYNFGEIGANAEQHLMGFFPYSEVMVPKVEFVTNDVVCAFAENQFTLYAMKERPRVIQNEKFETNIKSIFYNNRYVGVVLENLNGAEKYQLKVYNLNGKSVMDKMVNYDYDKVELSGEEILFYTNLECNILTLNGKEKFHFVFNKNIAYIIPINNFNKYFLIDNINIEEIKLVEAKKQE